MIARTDLRRGPILATDTPAPAAFRAVQVLDVLSQSPEPMTLTATAVATGLPKSSVANLLVTLEAAGMVRRRGSGWVVGYRALEIGQSVLTHTDVVTEFRRRVRTLPTLAGETVLLAVRDGLQIVYVARHDGAQTVRLASDIGQRMPAVVTSLGKAMLAQLPDDELDALLDGLGELPRPTRQSHATLGALRADLVATRERGFAVDFEQNTIGISCVGVAVADAAVPTAVSTTLLSQRMNPGLHARLVADLRDLAATLAVYAR